MSYLCLLYMYCILKTDKVPGTFPSHKYHKASNQYQPEKKNQADILKRETRSLGYPWILGASRSRSLELLVVDP